MNKPEIILVSLTNGDNALFVNGAAVMTVEANDDVSANTPADVGKSLAAAMDCDMMTVSMDPPSDSDWQWSDVIELIGLTNDRPESALFPYRVTLYEVVGNKFALAFDCMAENDDHAVAQAEDVYPGCEIINCEQYLPLNSWLRDLQPGDEVWWSDPDNDIGSGYYTVDFINGGAVTSDDAVLMLRNAAGSNAEVFAYELSPTRPGEPFPGAFGEPVVQSLQGACS